ncbi:uncharacterized protein A4U43_C07F15410 [Asparagus officinalis]|uniref:Uncharacterized protein n=1 Tax=Asparagus officinalis TaxID=4686 RepID=A0A5P1ECG0_ASPOF|nr:uncharacterized protein A4U43_C07F15410 [Asparagus officinalis]
MERNGSPSTRNRWRKDFSVKQELLSGLMDFATHMAGLPSKEKERVRSSSSNEIMIYLIDDMVKHLHDMENAISSLKADLGFGENDPGSVDDGDSGDDDGVRNN